MAGCGTLESVDGAPHESVIETLLSFASVAASAIENRMGVTGCPVFPLYHRRHDKAGSDHPHP